MTTMPHVASTSPPLHAATLEDQLAHLQRRYTISGAVLLGLTLVRFFVPLAPLASLLLSLAVLISALVFSRYLHRRRQVQKAMRKATGH